MQLVIRVLTLSFQRAEGSQGHPEEPWDSWGRSGAFAQEQSCVRPLVPQGCCPHCPCEGPGAK